MTGFWAAVALAPLLLSLFLLMGARVRAARAMAAGLALTVLSALFAWGVPPRRVAAALVEGGLLAGTILWILFGAILLFHVQRLSGAMDALRARLAAASPDPRVQVLLIAWLFGAFLESVAGFGTPLAVCAPLLVALGFPATGAVVLCLLANSAPVTFGAAGTPLLVGMTHGLGASGSGGLVRDAGLFAAGTNLLAGSLLPLVMVAVYARYFSPAQRFAWGFALWRPALLAGLGFTVPAWFAARYLGPEFPSLAGSVSGLLLVALALRLRPAWFQGSANRPPAAEARLSFARAAAPYLLLVGILALTRLLPAVKRALGEPRLEADSLLGTGIGFSFAYLYSPGTVFLVVALAAAAFYRLNAREAVEALRHTGARLAPSALTLLAALPMVRVFLHSGENARGLPAMPLEVAREAAGLAGGAWPLAAPFAGALGSLVSGSATFSNLMFSALQFEAAQATGAPPALVLGLQAVGAAAGNMMSVLNVVAACAVTGLAGREGDALRKTALPTLGYCLVAGLVGMAWAAAW